MGDFGYIGVLKLANIDVEKLIMSPERIKVEFAAIVNHPNEFDPGDLAKTMLKEEKSIIFNPDFFDDIKPKKSLFEKAKNVITEITRKKRK